MNPKLFVCCALLFAASTSACMQADLTGEETGSEQEAAVLLEQSDELAAIEAAPGEQNPWFLADEADSEDQNFLLRPDESRGQDDGAVTEAGCVHIQWCNEPGYWGTVCIWDACSYSAALAECTADAKYVCGGIKQPAQIR